MTRSRRVAIVYNDDAHLKAHLSSIELRGEAEVADSARDVLETLSNHHECSLISIRDSLDEALHSLRTNRPEIVFNLCEGLLGRPRWEGNFALLLEMLGIPYTGCESLTLQLTQRKGLIKRLLIAAGIPTPRGLTFEQADAVADLEKLFKAGAGALIVKPESEDGGVGVDSASVVWSPAEAEQRCRWIHERYRQAAIVEEFIDGPELNQAIYQGPSGMIALPPGEVVFDESLKPNERVVGFAAKWASGSAEDLSTISRTPADITASEKAELRQTSLRVASLLDVNGYCRLDFRQGPDGQMRVLDVNANPDIGPGSGFRKALDAAGIPFRTFLEELMLAKLEG
ncbi:MAG TPA: hypothetical protein VHL58_10000 [Thermoanaerobaculia bacterium]|nr:hypothetical protein [Thermoanaerobaculia bacterium]